LYVCDHGDFNTENRYLTNVLGPGFKYLTNDAKKSLLKRKKRMLNDLSKKSDKNWLNRQSFIAFG